MGLDMYLSAKRTLSVSFEGVDRVKEVLAIANLTTGEGSYSTATVSTPVLYWRKANAIHGWFVRNVQGGEDDCNEYHVSLHHLLHLMSDISDALTDEDMAKELFPVTEGFFFGGLEYDEYYFGELKRTLDELKALVLDEDLDFTYQSSW